MIEHLFAAVKREVAGAGFGRRDAGYSPGMADTATLEVRNNEARSRYELLEEGEVVAIADYQVRDDVVVFPPTGVSPERRGQGLGEQLVQGALDDVRAGGRKVVPACWFVAEFLELHPEYADLRA
jgi:predicted GNAT family acetyltransferase